jgi:hypothetical protein
MIQRHRCVCHGVFAMLYVSSSAMDHFLYIHARSHCQNYGSTCLRNHPMTAHKLRRLPPQSGSLPPQVTMGCNSIDTYVHATCLMYGNLGVVRHCAEPLISSGASFAVLGALALGRQLFGTLNSHGWMSLLRPPCKREKVCPHCMYVDAGMGVRGCAKTRRTHTSWGLSSQHVCTATDEADRLWT